MDKGQKERIYYTLKSIGIILGIIIILYTIWVIWYIILPKGDDSVGSALLMTLFITPIGLASFVIILTLLCAFCSWIIYGDGDYIINKWYKKKHYQSKFINEKHIPINEDAIIEQYMPEVDAAINRDPYEELKQKENV